jgi:OmpA-OmpF porin, OOP family
MFEPSAQAAETSSATASTSKVTTPPAGGVVYFPSGSAEIPRDGLEMIRAIAENSKQSTGRIKVTGYADTAGPADYNERLSQRRAEAVVAKLSAQGLPRKFINVDWRGENQLPVPTEDDVHQSQNRRVSIAMTSG